MKLCHKFKPHSTVYDRDIEPTSSHKTQTHITPYFRWFLNNNKNILIDISISVYAKHVGGKQR